MVDQQPPPTTKTGSVSFKTKAAIALLAAATTVSPFTKQKEGTFTKAYLDPARIPTVCTGHTGPEVKLGYTRTSQQCAQILIKDQTIHGQDVIRPNPELVDDKNGLMAAMDFTMNAGGGAWAKSPMSAFSKTGQKAKSCNSYIGYYTGATYPKPQSGMKCVPHSTKTGKWKCELPGLVTRRLEEAKICAGTYKFPK